MKNYYLSILLVCISILTGCSKSGYKENKNTKNFDEICNSISQKGLLIAIDGNIESSLTPGSPQYDEYIACVESCLSSGDPNCILDCIDTSGTIPDGGAFGVNVSLTYTTTSDIVWDVNPGT